MSGVECGVKCVAVVQILRVCERAKSVYRTIGLPRESRGGERSWRLKCVLHRVWQGNND